MEVLKYDTIIAGGGIAGLTAAVYLARAGQRTLLIEKNTEFGGLVSTFERDGFYFEAGARALINAGVILPMLEDLGIRLELVRNKVTLGVGNEFIDIEDLKSIEEYRNLLVKLYPESEQDIDNFIKAMRRIMKLIDVLYGIENPLFKDLKKDRNYIFKQLLPWLPKFILTVGRINKLNKPFEKYLEEIIQNPSLRDIISQHFFKGTPTFFALSYFSLYLEYLYPVGGVDSIARALVDKIIQFKGELRNNTMVKEVLADSNLIIDDKNQKYSYKNLIWAADLKTFYNITKLGNLDIKTKESFEYTRERVMDGKPSESVFALYLEVDLPLSYFGNISKGHFFYTPQREGLGKIHTSELDTIIKNWENINRTELSSWLDRFLKFNTYEISIPGLRDTNLAPANKSGLIVSLLVEYELFKKCEESGWYDDFRKEIEDKIINVLTETVYPELRDNVIKQFSFTPISIKNRIASTAGSIVGWSFEAAVPVVHKIQRSDKSVLTPISNIFQAGQWAYSPAGVPMAILTGKLAADRVNKKR